MRRNDKYLKRKNQTALLGRRGDSEEFPRSEMTAEGGVGTKHYTIYLCIHIYCRMPTWNAPSIRFGPKTFPRQLIPVVWLRKRNTKMT